MNKPTCHDDNEDDTLCHSCGAEWDGWACHYTTHQCPTCGEVYQEVYLLCRQCAKESRVESWVLLSDNSETEDDE